MLDAYLDSVDRMNVLHTVQNYPVYFFERFVGSHHADCIPLNKDVGICKQFNRLLEHLYHFGENEYRSNSPLMCFRLVR